MRWRSKGISTILASILFFAIFIGIIPWSIVKASAESSRWNVINVNNITGNDIVSKAYDLINRGAVRTNSTDWTTRTGYGSQLCFDCSGFVYRVLREVGLTSDRKNYNEGTDANGNYYITAHTQEQRYYGENLQSAVDSYKSTGSLSGFMSGDLLFYSYDGGNSVGHVAIYEEGGKCVHSFNSGVKSTSFYCGGWYNGQTLDSFLFAACRVVTSGSSNQYLNRCTPYQSWLSIETTKST